MLIKNLELQKKTRDNFESRIAEVQDGPDEEIDLYEELPEAEPIQKRKRRIRWKYLFLSLFCIILISTITYFGIVYKQDHISPKDQLTHIAGESIKKGTKIVNPTKKEKRYVSVLIMGIDTRGVNYNGEEYVPTRSNATRKMDVIMQIVYDRETKKMTFISIPRDTSLPVTEECMHQEREDQKYINRIYDMAEKNNCPFSGPDAMKKYVTYITGFKVDYYTIVTLDSFVELIDIVGEEHNGKKGMWVDVPRNIGDYCPNTQFGYDYVYFEKGRQFLSSKQVLCFIRVRKTSNDFDRNRRQQELMSEVGDRIMSSETLSNPYKLFQIYQSFKGKMEMSDVTLKDIAMGIEVLSEANMADVQKIVLDYEFGGTNALLTKPLYSPPGTHTRSGYYLIPTAWDQPCCQQDEWKLVRNYLHEVMQNPNAEIEQAAIFAYVSKFTGGKAVFNNDQYQQFKKEAPEEYIFYRESKYAEPMLSAGPDIQIFDFTKGKKRHIADKIAKLSGGKVYDGSESPMKPINHEEISIVVRVR